MSVRSVGSARLLTLIAVGVGLSYVTGCGSGVNARGYPAEPELGVIPTIVHRSDIGFPLDSYGTSPEQVLTISEAEDVLHRDCLHRFGFDYKLPNRQMLHEVDTVIGVIEEADAAELGYKNRLAEQDAKIVARAKAEEIPMSPAMIGVMTGDGPSRVNGVEVPLGGCSSEASQALGRPEKLDGRPGDENFVIRLTSTSYTLAESDNRLTVAFTQWSECMANRGYSYRNPRAANNDPAFASPTASTAEILTAKADVVCRQEHNVNGIWVAVITAYQNEIIANNVDALQQHQQLIDEQVTKATQVLSNN